jgi:citrate synthase
VKQERPVTELCTHSLTDIHYRDANLVNDLLGKKTFTEVMFMQITGRTPDQRMEQNLNIGKIVLTM